MTTHPLLDTLDKYAQEVQGKVIAAERVKQRLVVSAVDVFELVQRQAEMLTTIRAQVEAMLAEGECPLCRGRGNHYWGWEGELSGSARWAQCGQCKGTGKVPQREDRLFCPDCGGYGRRMIRDEEGQITHELEDPCLECGGSGKGAS